MASEPISKDSKRQQADPKGVWRNVFIGEIILLVLVFFVTPWFAPFGGSLIAYLVYFLPVICLCCLLGANVGFGYHWSRWIAFLIFIPVIGGLGGAMIGESGWEWLIFTGGLGTTVALTSTGLRLWKGKLKRKVSSSDSDALQFRIRDLLIWTTAIAILAGPVRLYLLDVLAFPTSRMWVTVARVAISMGLIVVANFWALLGQRVTTGKCIALVVVTLLLSLLAWWLLDREFFWMGWVSQFGILMLLLPLRWHGVRFVKTCN